MPTSNKTRYDRDLWLRTALNALAEKGEAAIRVDAIAARLKVTKGSFYHYFETKADLFYEASQYYWQGLKEDLDRIYSPSFTPRQQLENLIGFIIWKKFNFRSL